MNRIIPSLLVLSIVTVPFAASAQYQGQPTVVTTRMAVESWGPQRGPVGTEIVISGAGFSDSTEVYFGGQRVAPSVLSRTQVSFAVPRNFENGKIVLRKPGRADLVVGEFMLEVSAEIRSVVPNSGVPGSRVEIRGRGFNPDDQVTMNGRAIPIVSRNDRSLVVEIPAWGRSDFLVVTGPGSRARSPLKFEVIDGSPRIVAMEPASGAPGSLVRLSVSYQTDSDHYFYGRTPVPVVRRGSGWVEVRVPERASGDEFFAMRGPRGDAASAQRFELEWLPIIERLSTTRAQWGATIEILGRNFHRNLAVEIGGLRAQIVALEENRLTAVVPRGARTGLVYLIDSRARYQSPVELEIGYAMRIVSWGPDQGPPGTLVTIVGTNVGGTRVFYGDTPLAMEPAPRGQIRVRIPPSGGDQFLRLVSAVGETRTAQPFRMQRIVEVTAAAPLVGPAGTQVVVRGSRLNRVRDFFLNEAPLRVVARGNRSVVLEIPYGAHSGFISWTTGGFREVSEFRFEVYEPIRLSIDAVPDAADWGDEIMIQGEGFRPGVKVFFGDVEMQNVRAARDGRSLYATVPDGVRGREFVYVTLGTERQRSPGLLKIRMPRRNVPYY